MAWRYGLRSTERKTAPPREPMHVPPSTTQYLARHAEPEVQALRRLWPTELRFEHVLVVPAHAEPPSALSLLQDLASSHALLILVANDPSSAHDQAGQQTQHFLRSLRTTLGPPQRADTRLSLWASGRNPVLCIERSLQTSPIAADQGVGLARKIGADCALSLLHTGMGCARFIHTTDADARLPADYFAQTDQLPKGLVAATYAFEHEPVAPELAPLSLAYETHLRRYVLGLARAGSPYAFHSLGSTLAFEPHAYARVRGFPRRASAEDFYLLNKLAKIGLIARLHGASVRLQGRFSDRVPVGTGPALDRLRRGEAPRAPSTDAWASLTLWLRQLRDVAESGSLASIDGAALPPRWRQALHNALAQGGSARHRLRQLHTFFDGLRTRQFLRHRSSRDEAPTSFIGAASTAELRAAVAQAREEERALMSAPTGVPSLGAACNGQPWHSPRGR